MYTLSHSDKSVHQVRICPETCACGHIQIEVYMKYGSTHKRVHAVTFRYKCTQGTDLPTNVYMPSHSNRSCSVPEVRICSETSAQCLIQIEVYISYGPAHKRVHAFTFSVHEVRICPQMCTCSHIQIEVAVYLKYGSAQKRVHVVTFR